MKGENVFLKVNHKRKEVRKMKIIFELDQILLNDLIDFGMKLASTTNPNERIEIESKIHVIQEIMGLKAYEAVINTLFAKLSKKK